MTQFDEFFEVTRMNVRGYDQAQVCPNGHVANRWVRYRPEQCKEHCEKCGEKTMKTCPHCNAPIRGFYHVPGVSGWLPYSPPSYCHNCGNAFPWTERRIQAAIELAMEVGGLVGEEAEEFKQSVGQVGRDTPQTEVAAHRLKRLLGKVGQQTSSAIRDIIVDIASEAARKIIWPDSK